MQLIWRGKTDQVLASPEIAHPKILQQRQPSSHFQNTDTFAEWITEFISVVSTVRTQHELPVDEPALLILDAAHQHGGHVDILAENNIEVATIPKKQTHCFQPADMFVIAGLKQGVKRAWASHVEQMFAEDEAADATRNLLDKRVKLRRDRLYSYLAAGIDALSPAQVQKSWIVSGVVRGIFNGPAPENVVILY